MANRFQHLIDSLDEEAVVLNKDLYITYANPAWLRRMGVSADQAINRPCHEVLAADRSPCLTEACAAGSLLERLGATCCVCAGYRSRVGTGCFDVSASPVPDADGDVAEVILLFRASPGADGERQAGPCSQAAMHAEITDALLQAALIAGSDEGLQSVLAVILDQVGRVVNYDSASIALTGEQRCRIIAGRGFPPSCRLDEWLLPRDDAKLALMAETRQPVVIDDVTQDPTWIPLAGTGYIRSWIGAPLLARGHMIGSLNLDKAEPGYYSAEDARLVLAFANQAAVVIENAQLLEAERRRSAHLRLIAGISQQVLSILDPEALLDYAARAIQDHFSYYYVDIFVVEPGTDDLVLQASSYPDEADLRHDRGLRFRVGQEGITGRVASTGQPYLARDVAHDPYYVADSQLAATRSELVVPIRVGERLLGVLDLNSDRLDAFSSLDMFVAQSLADQLALGLENARLFSAEARRRREAETLQAATQALSSSLDLQEVFELILRELRQVVPYDSASVQQLKGDTLEIIGGHGFPNLDDLLGLRFNLLSGDNPNGEVIRTRSPVIVDDAPAAYTAFRQEPHASARTRSWLGVPLLFGDSLIGMLSLDKREYAFYGPEHARLATAFAAQAAIAIENARLFTAERKSRLELKSIQSTAALLSAELRLDLLLEQVASEAADAFRAEATSVMLWDGNKEFMVVGASHGLSKDYALRQRVARQRVEDATPRDGVFHPIYVPNLAVTPFGDADLIAGENLCSDLIIPLVTQTHLRGVLNVYSRGYVRTFSPAEIELAEALAAHAAVAIDNARLYQQAEQYVHELSDRADRLALINRISTAVNSTLDLAHILETAAREIALAFDVGRSYVIQFDHQAGWAEFVAEYPRYSGAEPFRLPLAGTPVFKQAAEQRQAFVVADPAGDPLVASLRELLVARDIQSLLVVPLIVKGMVVGVIGVCAVAQPRSFSAADVDLAQTIANQVGLAVENARLFEAAGRRVAELEAVREAALGLTSSLQLQEVLESILASSARLLPEAQDSHIFLYRDARLTFGAALWADGRQDRPWAEPRPEGLTYTVARQGEPILVPNIQDHPLFVGTPKDWTGAIVGLPLKIGPRVVGVMNISFLQPHALPESELRVLQLLADQAAVAIENARLYEEVEQRLRELALLFDMSTALASSLDETRVVLNTARQITAVLDADSCIVSRWDETEQALFTLLDYSAEPERWPAEPSGSHHHLSDFPASQQVLVQRLPRIIQASDPDGDPAELAWMARIQARSLLMVPMIVGDKAIGLLELLSKRREWLFSPTAISLCQTLANQAAAAMENARLFQAEREQRTLAEALHEATAAISSTLDLEQVLDRILEQVNHVIPGDAANILLIEGDYARSVRSRGYDRFGVQRGLAAIALEIDDVPTLRYMRQSGLPIVVSDTRASTEWQKLPETAWLRSYAGAPIRARDRVIGFLSVDSSVPGFFQEADAERLQAFAAQAAVAMENANLYRELSQHLKEVTLLNKVALAAASSLDLDDVLRRGMSALLEMPQFERAHVFLFDSGKGVLSLHPALAHDPRYPSRANVRLPLGQGICGRVAGTGLPWRVDDVRREPAYIAGYTDTLSEVAVPLRVGDRVVGVLDAQSSHLNAFDEEDERLLVTLAGLLSTVIDNARLFKEAQQRVRELTALSGVSQALNEARDLRSILSVVLDEAFALLNSHEGSILLIDPPGGNRLRMVADRGLGPDVMEEFNNRPVYVTEGTYRRALTSGRIVEVDDTAADTDFLEDVGSHARTITNVPLITEHRAIGLIAVDGLPRDDMTRRLLIALADMAAVAIDKERLHQETADRLAEVSTLYTLSTQITGSLALGRVLESIVTILKLTINCRACCIFLADPLLESLRLEASSGLPEEWRSLARLTAAEGIGARVMGERRPIYVADAWASPNGTYFDPAARSILIVPLVVRNQVIGVLCLDDGQPNAFGDEVRLLTIAAAQAAVAIENAQLYESVQGSYRDLEQAYDALRELDRMKSELVQNISHELRTPLTFIKGYVELLQDGDMGELTDEQRMALDIVAAKANVLSRLVDDIITLQHASRDRVRLSLLSLADVGHAALRAAAPSAAELNVTLVDDIPDGLPSILGDEQRLGQVLDNLLSNALKFTTPGTAITVRMFEEGAAVRTEVEDGGIGIPPDKLPHIFDRFYQVDGSTTRRFGGTGLGLAIVKQIVEVHGGHVGVRSEQNKGSCFYFIIPKAPIGGIEA